MSPAALPALHAALIAAHAVAGLIALCLGAIVLRPPDHGVARAFPGYRAALWLMVLCLAVVVAGDWPRMDTGEQALFGALTAFSCCGPEGAALAGAARSRRWRGVRPARRRVGQAHPQHAANEHGSLSPGAPGRSA